MVAPGLLACIATSVSVKIFKSVATSYFDVYQGFIVAL